MSIITRALVAASLIAAATAAQAQDRGTITTYVGGPKSNLTQTIRGSYAQTVSVRPRAHGPQAGFSGGANAIEVDEANSSYAQAAPVRPRAYRTTPAQTDRPYGRNVGRTGGANAIGVDEAN